MPRRRRIPENHDSQQQQFGEELRHWREARGMTVVELAQRVGKDRRTITGAEDGRDLPSEFVVHRLEDELQTQGLLIARYEGVLMEKRRLRLLRATSTAIPAPNATADDASTFIGETVPDGTLMSPGHRFVKTWTICNSGTVPWHDRRLTRVGIAAGTGLITSPVQTRIPDTAPGEEVIIAVPCVAQFVEGTSIAAFKMTDDAGRLYFPGRYFPGLQAQVTVVRELGDADG
ncbi:NBR1-Ig-like domain-containing protein [Microbacterium sp. PMB16]|uniref:NBR1-Ig-like domain-containing protein n=1 Tax=Microbacterium sp. PMB16 TaxID=3120157 RepID=UPI003F4C6FE1